MLLLLLGSCNLLKIVDRKQEKRFRREEMPLHVFREGNIRRSVHASDKDRAKLVLVHGYGASGIGQYYRSAIELNEHCDVILPDLLYCGKSTGDGVDYSIGAQVEHLRLLLDSLKVDEPVYLIGNSYGGIVSAYFADRYPEKVKKLVIYDAPVNAYRLSYADSLAKSLKVPSVFELLAPTNIDENKKSLDLVFFDQPYIPRFLRRQMVKYGSVPARPTQLNLLNHLTEREKQFNEYYFNWKMPVYLCWGEYDRLIPLETCYAIMQRYQIPAHRLHIFKDAAHAPNVEYPAEFVKYVLGVMNAKQNENE
jgi:pimeloyl-ACP methyl ester carboxylesterase